MRFVSVSILHGVLWLYAWGSLALSGCAAGAAEAGSLLPRQLLFGESSAPALFMSAAPDSPVLGFLGKEVTVEIAGPSVAGRVPVRVHGALLVRGYVPEALLSLRAQRHGKVRGTPVYLGPNDPVTVLGQDREAGRLRVRVTPKLVGAILPAFEGSYPAIGLAAQRPAHPEEPPPGEIHELAKGSALALYDQPDGSLITELPARAESLRVEVLSKEGIWSAVRVGSGPYLVGYTSAYLAPSSAPRESAQTSHDANSTTAAARASGEVPARLVSESGELKRVAAGAAVSFGDRVFAKLQKPGYARVLATYPSGEADVLVAVDDDVAVRGLVRAADLSSLAMAQGGAAQ